MGGESIKPIRKRIHVYFLMTAYYNPCEYDYAELEALLTKAYWGQAPI